MNASAPTATRPAESHPSPAAAREFDGEVAPLSATDRCRQILETLNAVFNAETTGDPHVTAGEAS